MFIHLSAAQFDNRPHDFNFIFQHPALFQAGNDFLLVCRVEFFSDHKIPQFRVELLANAQGRQMWAEEEASRNKAGEATQVDVADAMETQKKKKGVQSTFTAIKGGTSMNGALTPVGE